MQNMRNAGADRLSELSATELSRDSKKKLKIEIISAAVAVGCLLVGFLYTLISPGDTVVSALFYTIGFLVEGIPVFVTAIRGIIRKDLTNAMEMLVAIAITACYLSGQLVLSVLIPLILNVAHLLEERSIVGGREIIDGLRKMEQNNAVRVRDGAEEIVDVKKLEIGDEVIVRPGMVVPIDGVILQGSTHIDQKSLTGEPEPVEAFTGDPVFAGTVNLDSLIRLRVEKSFSDTSFAHILSYLEKAEKMAVPESRLIDRFMKYYIPFVLAVAGAVALLTRDLSKAIAVLVVSCPCGHMLVSSAPMIASLSVATRKGILIKNSKFLEEMNSIDAVVFDKTGTLTEGDLALAEAIPTGSVTQEELLHLAAIPASASTHPVSQALIRHLGETPDTAAYTVTEYPGKGMEAKENATGETIRFGNRAWFCELGICVDDSLAADKIGSVSFVARGTELLGAVLFSDRERNEAKAAVEALRREGVKRFVMLTGDRENVAKSISERIGITEYRAELMPEDKLNAIREIKSAHSVMAVGDGINDALALKEANVGISMGSMGSDLAIQSSDIALMNDNLMNVPGAIRLAKRTKKIIYQNLALSLGVSFVMILLSIFGLISVLAGAILHNVGAFAVILNSARILKLNKNETDEPDGKKETP